jgi:hypothetical protein
MARKYHQGYFRPRHPHKYRGDVNNIVYRSSWEKRFLEWCDVNPSVVAYHSEETVVPYICKTDGLLHKYYVDIRIAIKDQNGKISQYLVEIKPHGQTIPPKYPGKQTKRYIEEVSTFVKNQSKWEAATRYATERNMKFIILTEKELFESK